MVIKREGDQDYQGDQDDQDDQEDQEDQDDQESVVNQLQDDANEEGILAGSTADEDEEEAIVSSDARKSENDVTGGQREAADDWAEPQSTSSHPADLSTSESKQSGHSDKGSPPTMVGDNKDKGADRVNTEALAIPQSPRTPRAPPLSEPSTTPAGPPPTAPSIFQNLSTLVSSVKNTVNFGTGMGPPATQPSTGLLRPSLPFLSSIAGAGRPEIALPSISTAVSSGGGSDALKKKIAAVDHEKGTSIATEDSQPASWTPSRQPVPAPSTRTGRDIVGVTMTDTLSSAEKPELPAALTGVRRSSTRFGCVNVKTESPNI